MSPLVGSAGDLESFGHMSRVRVGDVFAIPIDDARAGVGQVVATYGKSAYYFAAFDTVLLAGEAFDPSTLDQAELLLLALSFDALLHHGRWRPLGNTAVRTDIPLPAYKVTIDAPDRIFVEDYVGTTRRQATDSEAQRLPYRKLVAAIRLQNALQAKWGALPWSDAYEALVPDYVDTTANLFA